MLRAPRSEVSGLTVVRHNKCRWAMTSIPYRREPGRPSGLHCTDISATCWPHCLCRTLINFHSTFLANTRATRSPRFARLRSVTLCQKTHVAYSIMCMLSTLL